MNDRYITAHFIEKHLPAYHPMFIDPPVRRDAASGRYLPQLQIDGVADFSLASPTAPRSRPELTDYNAMVFWASVFPDAMAELKTTTEEPKGRSDTSWSIRNKWEWVAVYEVLEDARNKYKDEGGKMGLLRKARRKFADNVTPVANVVSIASKVVPDSTAATPVLGALEVLLDIVNTAAKVRNQVVTGFDGLMAMFADVELFLSTFPQDKNIRKAAIVLTVAALDAIERGIGFFIRNALLKAGKAVLARSNYEKNLVDSLDTCSKKSKALMEEAAKSHIHDFHMYSQETQALCKRLLVQQSSMASGINSIERLLADHLKKKDEELEAARKEAAFFREQNMFLRSVSPLPQGMWLPPAQTTAPQWFISQEQLRHILGIHNTDLIDVAWIDDNKEGVSTRHRAQAEGIVNTSSFRNWITSTASAKLLIHWDMNPMARVSALTLFGTTLIKSLRANQRILSAVWFCSLHAEPDDDFDLQSQSRGGHAMLCGLVEQLLRQFAFDSLDSLQDHVSLAQLQEKDGQALMRLLEWLVHRLPRVVTMFFVIDGVVIFERNEHYTSAMPVFACLLRLVDDQAVQATVKLLFMSAPETDVVRAAFEDQDLVLAIHGLPQLEWSHSEERMQREVEGAMEETGESVRL